MIDPNELREDCLTILRETYNLDRSIALKLVDDTFLERVMDRMYEGQVNEIAWQLLKQGIKHGNT